MYMYHCSCMCMVTHKNKTLVHLFFPSVDAVLGVVLIAATNAAVLVIAVPQTAQVAA